MSHFPVRDFESIRICCQNGACNAVTELPLANVESVLKSTNGCCPVCRQTFTDQAINGGSDMVSRLAGAIIGLAALGRHVIVELPLEKPE